MLAAPNFVEQSASEAVQWFTQHLGVPMST
jgi:hypothetical protein